MTPDPGRMILMQAPLSPSQQWAQEASAFTM